MARKLTFNGRRKMLRICDDFSAAHPISSTIKVWPGAINEKPPVEVIVQSEAQILGGHTPVVYVSGGHGCIVLNHVMKEGG
jgi:hypothetical protein